MRQTLVHFSFLFLVNCSFGETRDHVNNPIDDEPVPIDKPDPDSPIPIDPIEPYDVSYQKLSETGLYRDIRAQKLNDDVIEYEPRYHLWSDNAHKRRFVLIPKGQKIDVQDMDHWLFPVGTKFWKTFSHVNRDNKTLLETRIIERHGPLVSDFYVMAFQWRKSCFDDDNTNDGDCDADAVPNGSTNVHDTDHDIPASTGDCMQCHAGQPNQILGFSAVQLSYQGTPSNNCAHHIDGRCPTLSDIASKGFIDNSGILDDYPVPGHGSTQAALGYLHANCGHCHQPSSNSLVLTQCYDSTGGNPDDGIEGFNAKIYSHDLAVTDTATWRTMFGDNGCGVSLVRWNDDKNPSCNESPSGSGDYQCTIEKRALPGDTSRSAVLYRMQHRSPGVSMPVLATEFVDPYGVSLVETFINSQTLPKNCSDSL